MSTQTVTSERAKRLLNSSKPYLKTAAIAVALAVLYLLPDILSKTYSAVLLVDLLSGRGTPIGTIDEYLGLFPWWVLGSLVKLAAVVLLAYRVARVHEVVASRWQPIRAISIALVGLLAVSGVWGVGTSLIAGEYFGHSAPVVFGMAVYHFVGFVSDMSVWIVLAIVAYFATVFDDPSIQWYRDVIVSSIVVLYPYSMAVRWTKDAAWLVVNPNPYRSVSVLDAPDHASFVVVYLFLYGIPFLATIHAAKHFEEKSPEGTEPGSAAQSNA